MPNAARCSDWRLYVILDRAASGGRDLLDLARCALQGGADVLQLRDKAATPEELLALGRPLLEAARAARAPLIINDHPEVAAALGADGVHLGQDDMPIAAARRLLGPDALIGQSTHSLAQAQAGVADGADYLGVGPVFPTPTKPDYGSVGLELVGQVAAAIQVPFVCIGGIDAGNAGDVRRAGGRCIAVVRAVCAASEPLAATRELKRVMADFGRTPSAPRI